MITRSFLSLLFLPLLVLLAWPAAAADPFYENLHEEGAQALARGDAERAAKVLRLACFGLLEEPPALARCLVRLAVAQGDQEDADAFREIFARLVVLERRFGAFAEAELDEELQRRFMAHVAQHVPAEEVPDDFMQKAVQSPP